MSSWVDTGLPCDSVLFGADWLRRLVGCGPFSAPTTQEFDTRQGVLVGDLFVAKHSKRSAHEDTSSVDIAAKALTEAGKLATVFNSAVQSRLSVCGPNGRVDPRVWGVQFLSCSTYTLVFSS